MATAKCSEEEGFEGKPSGSIPKWFASMFCNGDKNL